MGDMARGHDEVAVADFGGRLRRGAARNGEVLADLVAVADTKVAAFGLEILVERIAAEYRAGGDFVVLAEGGPALDEDVRFQQAPGADRDVLLHHAVLANAHAGRDDGLGVDAGGGGDGGGGIDGHGRVQLRWWRTV